VALGSAPAQAPIQPVQQQAGQQNASNQQLPQGDQSAQAADAMAMVDASDDDDNSVVPQLTTRDKSSTSPTDVPQVDVPAPKLPDATPVIKAAPPPPPMPPEAQFASNNHDKIITGLRTELLPNGGTMHIRLDPPELGALQVRVTMQDGVMTAAFETSNDDATKLLSHSLTQLKHALESQGVSVDKLHVQQSPRTDSSSNQKEENGQSQNSQNQRSAQQEQQRKEMIRRMWQKLGVTYDPLDMVA
jgi:flagellar hook-length control protein FliK